MHGKVHDTAVAGEAQIAKATIICPHLRYHMTGGGANISLQGDALQVGLPSLLRSADPSGQAGEDDVFAVSRARKGDCLLHSSNPFFLQNI